MTVILISDGPLDENVSSSNSKEFAVSVGISAGSIKPIVPYDSVA
jgi:hypothetical protein